MMEYGIKQVSSIHIEKTNDRSELLRADEVVGTTLKSITEDALQCMSGDRKYLWIPKKKGAIVIKANSIISIEFYYKDNE